MHSRNRIVWADNGGLFMPGEPGFIYAVKAWADREADTHRQRFSNGTEVFTRRVVRRTLRRVG
jgi:hypothetical protein